MQPSPIGATLMPLLPSWRLGKEEMLVMVSILLYAYFAQRQYTPA